MLPLADLLLFVSRIHKRFEFEFCDVLVLVCCSTRVPPKASIPSSLCLKFAKRQDALHTIEGQSLVGAQLDLSFGW